MHGYGQDAPAIECLQVNVNGDVTLNWAIPTNTVGFNHYEVLYSIDPAVTFNSLVNNLAPVSLNTYTHLSNIGLTNNVYYTVLAWYDDGSGGLTAASSDTLSTIYLEAIIATNSCVNCEGIPLLNWNLPFANPAESAGATVEIYCNYPSGTMQLLATLAPETDEYLHYIYNCAHEHMDFQIKLVMPQGCEFVSNVDGDSFWDGVFPATGILSGLSIDTNDDVVIEWQESVSPDVSYYCIYYCEPDRTDSIDSVNFAEPNWYLDLTYNSNDVNAGSYTIAAVDRCWNHDTTVCYSVMNLSVQSYVTCDESVGLNWTPYTGWSNDPTYYIIYESFSVTPGYANLDFIAIDTVTSLSYYDPVLQFGGYNHYQIQAVDTATGYSATSNADGAFVNSYAPPERLEVETATVISNDTVQVTLGMQPTVDTFRYELQRLSESTDSWEEVVVRDTSVAMSITFLDGERAADVFSYTYRVIAYNSCGMPVDTTNIGRTILLDGEASQERLVNTLAWSPYADWSEGVERYNIYRSIDQGPFELINELGGGELLFYEDDVSELTGSSGEFCYHIEAVERSESGRTPFISLSNEICLSIQPLIWVPNTIVAGGYNPNFFPEISFASVESYHMVIFSRWGDLIYETTQIKPGWDGTFEGSYVKEGVYDYYLTVKDGKGRNIDRFGFITLLNYD
jgi:gliding motility-associated-like protein